MISPQYPCKVKECMQILDQHQNAILTGDFNFEPTDEPQKMILPKFLVSFDIFNKM